MKHRQPGLFDVEERAAQLTQMGDPLVGLKARIDWEAFRPGLKRVHEKDRKSRAGAKPFDVVLMFKILVLQHLHNLSDNGIEYQIRDRFSFMRFLGLQLEDRVPDSKTVWTFRERLKGLNWVDALFIRFHEQLAAQDYAARAGQMIDATFELNNKKQPFLWGMINLFIALFLFSNSSFAYNYPAPFVKTLTFKVIGEGIEKSNKVTRKNKSPPPALPVARQPENERIGPRVTGKPMDWMG